jgi:hypothetical protein
MTRIQTTVDVIEFLGGNAAVGEITGTKPKSVWAWRKFDNFPPKTYLIMKAALAARGVEAPPALWGMTEAQHD